MPRAEPRRLATVIVLAGVACGGRPAAGEVPRVMPVAADVDRLAPEAILDPGGTRIFALDRAGDLVALDARDGRELWRSARADGEPYRRPLATARDVVIVLVPRGRQLDVAALAQADGAPRWRTQVGVLPLWADPVRSHEQGFDLELFAGRRPGTGEICWTARQQEVGGDPEAAERASPPRTTRGAVAIGLADGARIGAGACKPPTITLPDPVRARLARPDLWMCQGPVRDGARVMVGACPKNGAPPRWLAWWPGRSGFSDLPMPGPRERHVTMSLDGLAMARENDAVPETSWSPGDPGMIEMRRPLAAAVVARFPASLKAALDPRERPRGGGDRPPMLTSARLAGDRVVTLWRSDHFDRERLPIVLAVFSRGGVLAWSRPIRDLEAVGSPPP